MEEFKNILNESSTLLDDENILGDESPITGSCSTLGATIDTETPATCPTNIAACTSDGIIGCSPNLCADGNSGGILLPASANSTNAYLLPLPGTDCDDGERLTRASLIEYVTNVLSGTITSLKTYIAPGDLTEEDNACLTYYSVQFTECENECVDGCLLDNSCLDRVTPCKRDSDLCTIDCTDCTTDLCTDFVCSADGTEDSEYKYNITFVNNWGGEVNFNMIYFTNDKPTDYSVTSDIGLIDNIVLSPGASITKTYTLGQSKAYTYIKPNSTNGNSYSSKHIFYCHNAFPITGSKVSTKTITID